MVIVIIFWRSRPLWGSAEMIPCLIKNYFDVPIQWRVWMDLIFGCWLWQLEADERAEDVFDWYFWCAYLVRTTKLIVLL